MMDIENRRDHDNIQPPPAHMSPAAKPNSPGTSVSGVFPLNLIGHAMTTSPFLHSSMMNNNNYMSKINKPLSYTSPPPMPSNPENNVCRMIDYRNSKVAAFIVDGTELICLPQAFELFLKDLVGGLHTVYTKLKRLDIQPIVCNVEQVRILRGLGAIQPGVNRCKLLSCKDFDILYEDCTNSSARPGRPPKRSSPSHASPDTLEKLKKSRLDSSDFLFDARHYIESRKPLINGFAHHPYSVGAIPLMPFAHHMMSPPLSMAAAAHLGLRNDSSFLRDRATFDLLSPRLHEDKLLHSKHINDRVDADTNAISECHSDVKPLNLNMNEHRVSTPDKHHHNNNNDNKVNDPDNDIDDEDDDGAEDYSDDQDAGHDGEGKICEHEQLSHSRCEPTLSDGDSEVVTDTPERYSSVETLLLQIQRLIKVAAENARNHEKQINVEKSELKMHLKKEKDVREKIERKLQEVQRTQTILLRKLRKEKIARRSLQDQIDYEQKHGGSLGEDSPKSLSPDNTSHFKDNSSSNTNLDQIYVDKDRNANSEPVTERHSNIYDSYIQSNNSPSVGRFPYLPMVKSDA